MADLSVVDEDFAIRGRRKQCDVRFGFIQGADLAGSEVEPMHPRRAGSGAGLVERPCEATGDLPPVVTSVKEPDAARLGIQQPKAGNWHLHPAIAGPKVNALARILDDLPGTTSDRALVFLREDQPATPIRGIDQVKRRGAVVAGEHVGRAIRSDLVRFHRNPGSDRPVVAGEICIPADGKAGRIADEHTTGKSDPATLRLTGDGSRNDRKAAVKACSDPGRWSEGRKPAGRRMRAGCHRPRTSGSTS